MNVPAVESIFLDNQLFTQFDTVLLRYIGEKIRLRIFVKGEIINGSISIPTSDKYYGNQRIIPTDITLCSMNQNNPSYITTSDDGMYFISTGSVEFNFLTPKRKINKCVSSNNTINNTTTNKVINNSTVISPNNNNSSGNNNNHNTNTTTKDN